MSRRVRWIYTIGYAGHTPETFVEALKARSVSMLLDIRMTPISRKRGFSKTALHHLLEEAGIVYYHDRALGSPTELRRSLNLHHDYATFFASYREYLDSQAERLRRAADMVISQPVCLMCVEKCPSECHRSVVAEAIASMLPVPMSICHLPAPIEGKVRTNAVGQG